MKIKIGNDLRIRVKLFDADKSNPNIQSVAAFLVNTTEEEKREAELKNATKFINKYPCPTDPNLYKTTDYNLSSPVYQYRAYPLQYGCCGYTGFGTCPSWQDIYKNYSEDIPSIYRAEVSYTSQANVIDVYFPADAQKLIGKYKLAIKYDIYNPGYDSDDLLTMSVDFNSIFELVETTAEEENPATAIYVEMNSYSFWQPTNEYNAVSSNSIGLSSSTISQYIPNGQVTGYFIPIQKRNGQTYKIKYSDESYEKYSWVLLTYQDGEYVGVSNFSNGSADRLIGVLRPDFLTLSYSYCFVWPINSETKFAVDPGDNTLNEYVSVA